MQFEDLIKQIKELFTRKLTEKELDDQLDFILYCAWEDGYHSV